MNSAFTEGQAGRNSGFTSIKEKLEEYEPKESIYDLTKAFGIYLHRKSRIIRTISKLYNYVFETSNSNYETSKKVNEKNIELLSQSIKEYYINSAELLSKISQAYGFEYILLWQPNAFSGHKILKSEYTNRIEVGKKIGQDLIHLKTNKLMEDFKFKNFINISDALNSRKSAVYFDQCHMNEEGNMMVANRIYEIFKTIY